MAKYTYRLDGEPNFAWIFEDLIEGGIAQRWVARIQLNGELIAERQEEVVRRFVDALNKAEVL